MELFWIYSNRWFMIENYGNWISRMESLIIFFPSSNSQQECFMSNYFFRRIFASFRSNIFPASASCTSRADGTSNFFHLFFDENLCWFFLIRRRSKKRRQRREGKTVHKHVMRLSIKLNPNSILNFKLKSALAASGIGNAFQWKIYTALVRSFASAVPLEFCNREKLRGDSPENCDVSRMMHSTETKCTVLMVSLWKLLNTLSRATQHKVARVTGEAGSLLILLPQKLYPHSRKPLMNLLLNAF